MYCRHTGVRTQRMTSIADCGSREHLQGHPGWIEAVTFAPDGKLLAFGSRDGTIKLWDMATSRELASLTEHKNHLLAVAFSPDGKMLASGGHEQTIKLWEWKK